MQIDTEHAQLFDAINDLLDACSSGKGRKKIKEVAHFLFKYVQKHFKNEEKLQKRYHYPDYEKHKRFHEKYKKDLAKLENKLKDCDMQGLGELNMMASTLINHIRQEDKRLAAFIRENQ